MIVRVKGGNADILDAGMVVAKVGIHDVKDGLYPLKSVIDYLATKPNPSGKTVE